MALASGGSATCMCGPFWRGSPWSCGEWRLPPCFGPWSPDFFGLGFGALCALPYLVTGGPAAALSYWLAGLGFDLVHCIGEIFLVCLLLFRPLHRLLERLLRRYDREGP